MAMRSPDVPQLQALLQARTTMACSGTIEFYSTASPTRDWSRSRRTSKLWSKTWRRSSIRCWIVLLCFLLGLKTLSTLSTKAPAIGTRPRFTCAQAAVLGAGRLEDVGAVGWMVASSADSYFGRMVPADLADTKDFVSLGDRALVK